MISIIVPVYNVEPYLPECLNSILAQTYTDLDILLIDDGSTDRCPEICDAYREKDDRIRVIHTENRGLAAVRNLGVDSAHGDWIMFVDSDDLVEPTFCELPYRAATESGADLVVFGLEMFYEDGHSEVRKIGHDGFISARIAVDAGRNAAWNKLYRRSLFEGIRYPEGRLFEDVATTHRLVYKAQSIIAVDKLLYHYRIREGSISKRSDAKRHQDQYLAFIQRCENLKSYGYPEDDLEAYLLRASLRFLMQMEPSEDDTYSYASKYVKTHQAYQDALSAKYRNALRIWNLSPALFHSYYREKRNRAEMENSWE